MKKSEIKKWAWSYAADVISADANAGYFDAPDDVDRQECIKALKEVADAMRKKSTLAKHKP